MPPFPVELLYIWKAYWRLRRRKGGSGFGISPIEWPDIDAFVRNTGLVLQAWETELIEQLDGMYLVSQQRLNNTN